MFKVFAGSTQIKYENFTFPGGEESVKLDETLHRYYYIDSTMRINITGNIESSKELIELLLLTDALRRFYNFYYENVVIHLTVPYFPYARQDRVMVTGESFSLKVITDIINAQNYRSVTIYDPHSEVVVSLLNNCSVISQVDGIRHLFNKHPELKECILVAPDAGALKKTQKISQEFKMNMIHAEKQRDLNTGEITGTRVYDSESFNNKDYLIVDDICDGGRTFIELAKELRKTTNVKIFLYVTHGIFSKGLDVFDNLIEKVYCRNVFSNVQKDHPVLKTNLEFLKSKKSYI